LSYILPNYKRGVDMNRWPRLQTWWGLQHRRRTRGCRGWRPCSRDFVSCSRQQSILTVSTRHCPEDKKQFYFHFCEIFVTFCAIMLHLVTFCAIMWHLVTSCDILWHCVTLCDFVWLCVTLLDKYWLSSKKSYIFKYIHINKAT